MRRLRTRPQGASCHLCVKQAKNLDGENPPRSAAPKSRADGQISKNLKAFSCQLSAAEKAIVSQLVAWHGSSPVQLLTSRFTPLSLIRAAG